MKNPPIEIPVPDTLEIINREASIFISPVKVKNILFIGIALLVTASISGYVLKTIFKLDSSLVNVFISMFNVALEFNIPTLFSFVLFLLASALNFLLWFINRPNRKEKNIKKYWLVLSFIFLFLSFDELLQLHELFNRFSQKTSQLSSYFYYSWVIPYSVVVIATILFFIKFLLILPLKTRKLFILSGFVFVGGALGLEFIQGHAVYQYGVGNLVDVILYTIEETFEMCGITLFIYSLLDYIANKGISLVFLRVARDSIPESTTATES